VYLDRELSTPAGLAAQMGFANGTTVEERVTGLVMGLMRYSVRKWTFEDEDGPIAISPDNVDRMLPWLKGGKEVADAVSTLHQATALAPFVASFKNRRAARKKTRTKSSSPDGSTEPSST